MAEKKVGDLTPFRDLSEELRERAERDSEYRGDRDPGVLMLTTIRKRLEAAIEKAESQELTISIDDYAEREGIGRAAAYKRFQAGGIPGAEKRPGVGIVIPADYATRTSSAA